MLTTGVDKILNITDLISVEELQKMQDLFSKIHQVASIITYPDGTPITQPSNFHDLCKNVIRSTETGRQNCYKSDSQVGVFNAKGATIHRCINAGLLDAGVCMKVNDIHLATWIIGQAKAKELNDEEISNYASIANVDKNLFKEKYNLIPLFGEQKFKDITWLLYIFVNQLVESKYKNFQLDIAHSELKLISENLPDIIWKAEYYPEQKTFSNTYISEVADKLLRLPKGTINNSFNKYFSYIDNHFIDDINKIIYEAVENINDIRTFQYKVICGDGIKRWFESTGRIISLNNRVEIFGLTKDISEHKNLENYYQNLVKNMPSGVSIFEPMNDGTDFFYEDFNNAAEKITNTKREFVLGKSLLKIFPNMYNTELYKALKEIYITGNEKHLPPYYYKDEHSEGWRENSLYKSENGKIISLFKDVTELKDKELQLISAKEKAEENDRLKTAFLANMSHEIRTPMNGILGFIDLLREPNLCEKERNDYINIIENSGKRLLGTINDIITYSEIEASEININKESLLISDLFQYHYNFFKIEAKDKELGFNMEIEEQILNRSIKTDPVRFNSIMTNLLKNALKFTKEGQINFGCSIKGSWLYCYVEDTGRGIEEKHLKKIFQRFIQADSGNSRDYEGNGLGLAICKAYVEKLGGEINVESKIGEGSRFEFILPI